jgi:hypothetical protein
MPPKPKGSISSELAEAFAEAVFAYDARDTRISIKVPGNGYVSLIGVCDLVERFNDQVPEPVFSKLRSYMHHMTHGELVYAMETNAHTYATAARCYRSLLERG